MGKKHIVMFLGFGYFMYSAFKYFKFFKSNPMGYLLNQAIILFGTLIILYLIYLGEKE